VCKIQDSKEAIEKLESERPGVEMELGFTWEVLELGVQPCIYFLGALHRASVDQVGGLDYHSLTAGCLSCE
jgi:hypothetical protein